ncbi:LysE family translocator [Shewanella sp. YLB-07]|uniref:LysE family translocator n=1 Tax=Shewanella sp. YLB-07 TaxID=2601268 RepID=UPI00128D8236|nr:LysE family translocator [Shewanella sp. YLB-07]
MSNIELFIAWFTVMFPLVISPGPANVVFAASGASMGFRRSLPLIAGIDIVFVFYSLLIGFGFGAVIQSNNTLFNAVQILGAIYLLYLSYRFISPKVKQNNNSESASNANFTFLNGVIIQLLNPKGLIMLILMFSLFSSSEQSSSNILTLSLWLCILNVSSHMLWVAFGSHILRRMNSGRSEKFQAIFFATCLALVSIWIITEMVINL